MLVAEAFAEIAALAQSLGVTEINGLPGCWEHQVDKRWWFAVNGHREAVECSRGFVIDPFDCYIEYNGWPAGSIHPGGGIIAGGEGANEDNFIEALQKSDSGPPQSDPLEKNFPELDSK